MKTSEKLANYIKTKIDIDISSENAVVIMDSLGIDDNTQYNEAIEERLDAIFDSFDLNNNVGEVADLVNILTFGKDFNLNIKAQTDDQLLDTIEIINELIKGHSYKTIAEITPKELIKIKLLYQTFGKALVDLNLENIENINKLSFEVISSLQEVTQEDLKAFCNFISQLGINFNISYEEWQNASKLQQLITDFSYKDTLWLKEKEIKKISLTLDEFGIKGISSWQSDTQETLSLIVKEFDLDLSNISKLKLIRKITDIKKLKLSPIIGLDKVESKLEVIKFLKKYLENLNQLEITKLAKLIDVLEIDNKKTEDIKPLLSWLEDKGVELEISKIDDREFEKIKNIIAKLELTLGKKLKDIDIGSISVTEKLLSAFSIEDIITAKEAQLKKISHVIQSSADDIKDTKNYYPHDLNEVFKIFDLNPNTEDFINYDKTRKFLNYFELNLAELSESEANNLVSTMVSLGIKQGEELITNSKLQEAISEAVKTFEYNSLLEINTKEIEKLILLTTAAGVEKISEIKKEDISKIKLICESLEFRFKDITREDIEVLVHLLGKTGFKEAGSKQGWFSYLTKGQESAFKEQLIEIKNKIKLLGYDEVLDFDQERYQQLGKILGDYSKSFATIGLEELEKLSQCYKNFGHDVSKKPFYKLQEFSKVLSLFGKSPFHITAIEEGSLKFIEKIYEKKITDLTANEIKQIIELNNKYKISIADNNFSTQFAQLEKHYKSLGYISAAKINEEEKLCILDLESLSQKTTPLNKLASITELVTKFVPKVEELELAECKNLYHYVKSFDYESGTKEQQEFKAALAIAIPIKCKLGFEEDVKAKKLAEIEQIITNYNKYQECKATPEDDNCRNINGEEFSDTEAIAVKLCSHYHEDL